MVEGAAGSSRFGTAHLDDGKPDEGGDRHADESGGALEELELLRGDAHHDALVSGVGERRASAAARRNEDGGHETSGCS